MTNKLEDLNFVPIRTSTLSADTLIPFNIYIKLPSKYLMYIKSGDDIELDRLKGLKKKKVRKLFIDDSDEGNYQRYLDACLDELSTNENISTGEKAEVAIDLGAGATDEMYEAPESERSYNASKSASKSLMKLVSNNNAVLEEILNKKSEAGISEAELVRLHAVKTSSLAIRFGTYLELPADSIENLAMAALWHDIGYLKVNPDSQKYFCMDLKDISQLELKDYFSHPVLGAQILQDKSYSSPEILDLIMTHEERIDGSGWPNKLQKLSKEQEVHSLCCHFDREVTCLGKKPQDVIQNVMLEQIGTYDLELLKTFSKFLKELNFSH